MLQLQNGSPLILVFKKMSYVTRVTMGFHYLTCGGFQRLLYSQLQAPHLPSVNCTETRITLCSTPAMPFTPLRNPKKVTTEVVYDVMLVFWRVVTNLFFREIRPRGAFNIPRDGPVIFAIAPHHNQVRFSLPQIVLFF
jgi:hypothetical protein